MSDTTTEVVQELIGQPTYSLVNGTWVPPAGRELFTPNELNERKSDNVADATTVTNETILMVAGRENTSSVIQKLPSGRKITEGWPLLFVFFGLFSFAVILVMRRYHDKRRAHQLSAMLLLLTSLILQHYLVSVYASVSNGSSIKRENSPSSLSCFTHLQDARYQDIQWERANETQRSQKERKHMELKCPRISWKHNTHDPSCNVDPLDAHSFLSTFRGRTLLFAGDSLSFAACRDFQEVLTVAGYDSSKAKSSYGANPIRRGFLYGCQEYEYGVMVCCSWLAFSNSKKERRFVDRNLFSGRDGIALNVLTPSDILLWNTGVHHTSNFAGTISDMAWLINKTLSEWEESKSFASVPSIWWKESYAQHFKKGHWDSWADVKRYQTRKYKNLKRQCYDVTAYPVENETGIYNQAAEPIVSSFEVPILRVYKASVPLHTQHFRNTDCTHFCGRDRGPLNHDHSLLATLIKTAIAGGRLPALPKERFEENNYDIQHRWDMLMEHPTDSLLAKLKVCANSKTSTRAPPTWEEDKDGPMPSPLKKCLEHSELVHREAA